MFTAIPETYLIVAAFGGLTALYCALAMLAIWRFFTVGPRWQSRFQSINCIFVAVISIRWTLSTIKLIALHPLDHFVNWWWQLLGLALLSICFFTYMLFRKQPVPSPAEPVGERDRLVTMSQ